MKNLIYLFLLFVGIAAHGQVTDAAMKTQADYIGTHTFDPSRTKTLDYDLINNKVPYVGMVTLSGTNTYSYTGLGAFTSIPSGFTIDVKFPNDNTGASSLNINSIGAIPIVKGVSTALAAGDIKAGKGYRLFYDGTNFQLSISNAVGSTGDIQINLAGSFDATPNLNYDKTTNTFRAASGLTVSGSGGTRNDNFYLGLNHTDNITGTGRNRWNNIIGEQHTILNESSATNRNIIDSYIFGSFFNKLHSTTGGGNMSSSGIVGALNSMIEIDGGEISFGTQISGGAKNLVTPKQSNGSSGTIIGNYIIGGAHNISDGHGSGASGYWGKSSGMHSFTHGFVTTFTGGGWVFDATYNPDVTPAHTGTVARVLASGKHAINMTANSPDQTPGNGVTGDYAGAFAGRNAHVSGNGSVALGGYGQTVTDSATVGVPNLQLSTRPVINDTTGHLLTYNWSTGKVQLRNASSNIIKPGNAIVISNDSVHVGGNIIKDLVLDSDVDATHNITIGANRSPIRFSTFTGDATNGYISFSNSNGISGWDYYDIDRVTQLSSFKINWLSAATNSIQYSDVFGNFGIGGRGFLLNGSDGGSNTFGINIDETGSSLANTAGSNSSTISAIGINTSLMSTDGVTTNEIKTFLTGSSIGSSFTPAAVAHVRSISSNTVAFRVDENGGTSILTLDESGAARRMGFFGVTPSIQATNTTAINTLLVNYGLIASGATTSNFSTNLTLTTAGNGILIKEGTNATSGVATLVAGTVVVNTTKVTANSRIQLTHQNLGTITVPVGLAVSARTAGTSFTILSGNLVDTSLVAWTIIEPAP